VRRALVVLWLALVAPSAAAQPSVPAHNAADLKEPPPRPDVGDAADKARRLFEAIQRDEPAVAADFFFPREAFLQVKAMAEPGRYWDRLRKRYDDDIHALHAAHPELAGAEFVRFELVKRGGWVKVGEEGNKLPYWVSRHSWLHYKVGDKPGKLEVRVCITWDGRWYITHLSEFR
jgi:hypothetical protein